MFIVWTLVTTEMNNVNKYKGRKKNKSLFTKFQLFILLNIVYDHLSIKELITMSFYHSNLIYKLNSRLINKDFHSFFHLLRIKKADSNIIIIIISLKRWQVEGYKEKEKVIIDDFILYIESDEIRYMNWLNE